jgi:hypothetical protein
VRNARQALRDFDLRVGHAANLTRMDR